MEGRGVCDVVINVVHTAALHTQTHCTLGIHTLSSV
jgi:hypothetical protein